MTGRKLRGDDFPGLRKAFALFGAVFAALLIAAPAAQAVKFPAPSLDLYVDSHGYFNLAVPGETEGLFEDGPGPGITAGQAGLALWVNQLGGSAGLGQATPYQGISGPSPIFEDSQTRIIETRFAVMSGEANVLEITQNIVQSKVARTVLVVYSVTNLFGDNITIRPYLLGNLRLDPANSAIPAYTTSPIPRLTIASTTTPRSIEVFPTTDQPPESVGVEAWDAIVAGRVSPGIPLSPFLSTPVTDPAFGIEWSTWMDSTLPDLETAEVSATYLVTTSLPEPVRGSTAVVEPVRGTVLIKAPGGGFEELEAGQEIPVGSLVDTRGGTVRLTSAGAGGTDQTADFRYGLFRVTQGRASPLTTLKLAGPLSRCGPRALRAAKGTLTTRALRKGRTLWGRGKGKFKVSGRLGSGSVRGTTWQVTDLCDGSTRIKSISGTVEASDSTKGKKFRRILRSGQSYVARPRR